MSPRGRLFATALLTAAACSRSPAPAKQGLAALPQIDGAAALEHIKRLSTDEMEGRAPGGKGEDPTIAYLTQQFQAAGLQPGNPDGTFVQKVPLVSLTSSDM